MSDKTFKQLLDESVVTTADFPEWRERWYDLDLNGENPGELWEWLGFESEEDFDDFYWDVDVEDRHCPVKIAADIDPNVKDVAEDLWHYANHHMKGDASYVRNGATGISRDNIHRIVYGDSDLVIIRSYLESLKYAVETSTPELVKTLKAALRGEKVDRSSNSLLDLMYENSDSSISDDILDALKMYRRHFRASLHNGTCAPDGYFEADGTIFHWEEDGEYYQMVQPSMGTLVAEFILADPENPHAKKMAKELKRISEGYSKRIAELDEVAKNYRKDHPVEKNPVKRAINIVKRDLLPQKRARRVPRSQSARRVD